MTAQEINDITGGELIGSPSLVIDSLNRIDNAGEKQFSFVVSEKYAHHLLTSKAGLILVPVSFKQQLLPGRSYILHDDPYQAFLKVVMYLEERRYSNPKKLSGISPKANIKVSATLGQNVYIGDGAFIDDNVVIGDNVKIYSNATISSNSRIDEGTIIYSGVRIYYETLIGKNCIIHANAVIGSDGFGYVRLPSGEYIKIPQIGNVIIGNNCEIGACTTIDRSFVGSTIIEDGVIIDNLVQIAHNVEIGEGSAFASQSGVAGSTKIGKRVRLGGQAGTAGHITIADDVTILAKGGIAQSIQKKGEYFGAPARPKRDAFRIEAATPHLPEMYKELKRLRDEIEQLKNKNKK